MYLLRSLIILFGVITLLSSFFSGDCRMVHNGRFRYMADNEEVIVTISDTSFMESYQGGKHYIKAQLDWITDCEYNIVITKVNAPGAMYATGDEINVKINKVEGNDVFYTATVKRVSWDGKFTRLADQVSGK